MRKTRPMEHSPMRPTSRRLAFVLPLCALAAALLAQPRSASADPKAVAEARKQLSEANAAQTKAQNVFDKAKEAVKQELTKSPDFVAAMDQLKKAKVDYDTASK